jgi:uncharacterized protein YqhQ
VLQILESILARWDVGLLSSAMLPSVTLTPETQKVFGIDMSIENLRSQTFSHFIFGFLIVSVIIFCVIIFLYLPKQGGRLKTGEKIMFGAIIVGVIIAVCFGYLQLMEGYLV